MTKLANALRTGLGLAVAATAGAYFLYKKNPRFRQQANAWSKNMKKEIFNELGSLKNVNRESFNKVVDQVGGRFEKLKDVNKKELAGLVKDLKESWRHFSTELADASKPHNHRKKPRPSVS